MTVVNTARAMLAAGRKPLPVKRHDKATQFKDWSKRDATLADFSDEENIAERLDQIVDVDLDCREARELAEVFLPETGRVHGRPSTGPSHFFYRVPGLKNEAFKDIDGSVMLETRTGSTHYTLIPPSVVMTKGDKPQPETLQHFKDGEPGEPNPDAFRVQVVLLVAATLIASHWASLGSRHEAAGALAGFLAARGGADREAFVQKFIGAVVRVARDDEPEDRLRFAMETLRNFRAGGKVTGGPTLERCLPKEVVARLYELFKVNDPKHAPRELKLVSADTIEIKSVKWLWRDRVPLGSQGLVAGREGIGKSMLSYTLAADITRGRVEGVFKGQPRSVIVCATEDSWEHTITPRLLAAGADLSKIFRVDVITTGVSVELSLPSDVEALTAKIVERGDVALVLLDPLIARLASKLDTHKDAEVRQALEPISRMADEAGVVVLGIIHVNKGSSRDPLNMVMGSRAFAAVARFVLFVAVDPDDEDRRLVGTVKNNLGRTDLPTKSYTITNQLVTTTAAGDEIHTGKLVWGDDDERSIREVIGDAAAKDRERKETPRATAAVWLKNYLGEFTGPALREEVMAAAQEAGHHATTLKRAATELEIVITSAGRKTMWALPAQQRLPGTVSAPRALDQGPFSKEGA